jgi:hypothetical protein
MLKNWNMSLACISNDYKLHLIHVHLVEDVEQSY